MTKNDLLKSSLDYYDKHKDLDFVVKPSLPVLYFGDIKSYLKSEYKVVTAALNPSDIEFKNSKEDEPSFFRFPEFKGDIISLEKSLNNYFENKPYTRWFGNSDITNKGFIPILNGMDCCYYSSDKFKNTSLHTDICSPLATNPTWSGLNEIQKNLISEDGFNLWKKLIYFLKPDLILVSLSRKYLKLFDLNYINNIKTVGKKSNYCIDHYEIKIFDYKTNLIWGSAQNTPFQPFKNKRELGQKIKSSLGS